MLLLFFPLREPPLQFLLDSLFVRDLLTLKLRQPLRRLVVQGAAAAEGLAGEIADELSVKEVEFGPVEATELRVKPNLPVLGPKLGMSSARCGRRSRRASSSSSTAVACA